MTVARTRLTVLFVLFGLLVSACNSQPAEPPTTAAQPSISDPMISDPTPQEPGKEVGISIDVSSAGGATLNYTWGVDGGKIIRGQGSPAITYRVPQEPGTYNIRVRVEWDGQSVEKVTSIQVEDKASTIQPTSTSSPPAGTSTSTPHPSPTTSKEPESNPAPTRLTASAPTLMLPEQGQTYQNPISFQWQGRLNTGQTYLVRVWHIESGHSLQSAPLSTTNWSVELPGDKIGDWRWSVSVMQGGSTVTKSDEGMFWFNPFPGGGGGGGDGEDDGDDGGGGYPYG